MTETTPHDRSDDVSDELRDTGDDASRTADRVTDEVEDGTERVKDGLSDAADKVSDTVEDMIPAIAIATATSRTIRLTVCGLSVAAGARSARRQNGTWPPSPSLTTRHWRLAASTNPRWPPLPLAKPSTTGPALGGPPGADLIRPRAHARARELVGVRATPPPSTRSSGRSLVAEGSHSRVRECAG